MSSFAGLGKALKWIRQRQGKKQYEVAEAAKITKAMLSSYENEKQKPAIETLERILDALEIDLDYLAYAIRAVRQEEERLRGGSGGARSPAPFLPGAAQDLERTLGLDHRLEAAEEQAVSQMMEGFHSLLRYMLRRTDAAAREIERFTDPDEDDVPDDGD